MFTQSCHLSAIIFAFSSVCCSKWAELENRSRKFSARFGSRFLCELLVAAHRNKSVRHISAFYHCATLLNVMQLLLCDFAAGRLLRAYNIEFNWFKLSSWINITEQWPYRLSWIILEVEDNPDIEDPLSLKNVYDRSAVFMSFVLCKLGWMGI